MGAQYQSVNLSLYRLRQTLRSTAGWVVHNFQTICTWGWHGLTPRPPFHKGNIPGTQFCYRRSRSQGRSAARRMKSKKNPNETIGTRTRDSPDFPAPPREYLFRLIISIIFLIQDDVTWRRYLIRPCIITNFLEKEMFVKIIMCR
jgi:hypothetical protein